MFKDCLTISNQILENVKQDINDIKTNLKIQPKMVIINVNNNLASQKYINIKLKVAQTLGVTVEVLNHINTPHDLIKTIQELNNDDSVHGYLIQLPLPSEFDQKEIFEYIDIKKDLDGLSSLSVYRNVENSNQYYPKACTANGIMHFLEDNNIDLSNKNVVIVNRSSIIGKPLFNMLLNKNATVTICHSKTQNLQTITQTADILITGIGKPLFFDETYVNPNAIIIDAGISVVDNKVVGDCNYSNLKNKCQFITPVPNGVGKLTVSMIFKNLVDLIVNFSK